MAALLLAVLVGACSRNGVPFSDDNDDNPTPVDEALSVDQTTFDFEADSETITVTVTANVTWRVASNTASEWLTATKTNDNTLSLKTTSNNTIQSRSGEVTIRGNNKTISLTVTQAPANGEMFTVNGVQFKMIRVEGGTFTMGATNEQGTDAESNERPVHSVTLSTFFMGETEVTQELWQTVMGSNPSAIEGPKKPVEQVTWNECQEFIIKLNQLTGKAFRLPTEAEWEFAARGGNKSELFKYAGSNLIDNVAWYRTNSLEVGKNSPDYGTHDVATKKANELGFYDMSGNVWEWCSDWFGSYSASQQKNPTGAETGTHRVFRGGSWGDVAKNCRVTDRGSNVPASMYNSLGFRLAL